MMRDSASECSGCGSEERWLLHNIRHRGNLRRVCTSCVLKIHPGSFCPHCIEVYEGSIPPLHERVLCSKCSSVSHLACVGLENARQYVCPTCSNPSHLFFSVGSSDKKSKISNGESVPAGGQGVIDQKLSKVFLSAARIAASSMAKAATAARVEAERRAKEAAFTRKKAKEALERVASLMAKEKEKRKGKNSTVAPASVQMMEQNKKPKGNTTVPAAVAAQKPIQNSAAAAVAAQKPIQQNFRSEGKLKSEGIPTPLTNSASRDKERWAGVQLLNMAQGPLKIDDEDEHKGPSVLVVARQQVQNPFAVSENKISSNSLNSHKRIVEKEEQSNGVFPVPPVAGQLQHSNSHDMEEDRGKSGRPVDADAGSQQPQSNQDPLASTTNSGVLLTGSSNTES